MNARTGITIIAAVLVCGSVHAAGVDWISGIGAVPPPQWSITPSNPSTADVITFTGPTDHSYGNPCNAEQGYGGDPYLSINATTKVIELKFQGPPPAMCTLILMPTVGFVGDFGPLAAGSWTFKCTNILSPFQINFTVGGTGQTIYVDENAPLVIWTPDGSSWMRAYPSLQDGLAAAQPGDTIRVADGTYEPDNGAGITSGDRAASFEIPDNVTVLCGYAGYGAPNPDARNVDDYPVVLSGDLAGNDGADFANYE